MKFDSDTPPVVGLMRPAVALVTGASRGIGLALTRSLLANVHVDVVHAVSRGASRAQALEALAAEQGPRLHRIDADITRPADLASLAASLDGIESLDLVVNAAGVLHGDGLAPEKSIEQVEADALARVFALNAFAPILLARTLMPWLSRRRPAVFASVSARVGSIGDNRTGGWYAYRASKAAQNQLMRTFSIEWRRRNPAGVCLLLHPGTVETELSAPFQSRVPAERLFDPMDAAARLLHIVANATPADSGRFIAWDGTDIPW